MSTSNFLSNKHDELIVMPLSACKARNGQINNTTYRQASFEDIGLDMSLNI